MQQKMSDFVIIERLKNIHALMNRNMHQSQLHFKFVLTNLYTWSKHSIKTQKE